MSAANKSGNDTDATGHVSPTCGGSQPVPRASNGGMAGAMEKNRGMEELPMDEAVRDRLAVALDVDDLVAATRLARSLAGHFRVAKIGLELYTAAGCLLYTSPSPRDRTRSRMPSSA